MLVAVLALREPRTQPVVAVEGDALPRVVARAPIIKHDEVARDSFAVGFCPLVVDLGEGGRSRLVFIARCACLLCVLVHPRIFVVSVFGC